MTPWTVAPQAPLSMGFSRQEDWSGLPFPSPADLPNPGVRPRSPALQAESLLSEPPGKPYFLHKYLKHRKQIQKINKKVFNPIVQHREKHSRVLPAPSPLVLHALPDILGLE